MGKLIKINNQLSPEELIQQAYLKAIKSLADLLVKSVLTHTKRIIMNVEDFSIHIDSGPDTQDEIELKEMMKEIRNKYYPK